MTVHYGYCDTCGGEIVIERVWASCGAPTYLPTYHAMENASWFIAVQNQPCYPKCFQRPHRVRMGRES